MIQKFQGFWELCARNSDWMKTKYMFLIIAQYYRPVKCSCLLDKETKRRRKIKDSELDFPGGAVDKNLPANSRDTGLIPDLGRFHMPWSNYACVPQLLSLCSSPGAATTEAQGPWSLGSATREAAATGSLHTGTKGNPCLPQPEKACVQQQRPSTAQNTYVNK